jgi:formamidopyrimidine-DNA glycosylase
MPELPDILLYQRALADRIVERALDAVSIRSPFLLRTFEPPVDEAVGRKVLGVRRIGKRIVWEFEGDLFFVFHLMIAGRFHLKPLGTRPTRKVDLAAFDFESGTLMLTEAASKKRAALSVVLGEESLAGFDRGGLDVLNCDPEKFRTRLTLENRTLKRALTDPQIFDGIGNAYSDEILHAARLSPIRLTLKLTEEEIRRLFDATRLTLRSWIERLGEELGDGFPEKVTAFRDGMAVHGRFGKPCPVCGTEVQRIRYADNETNYCPRCQTDGKVLADRSLSRLLKKDWPRRIEELEGNS